MTDTDPEEDMMLISSWEEHYKACLKVGKKKEFLQKFNAYVQYTNRLHWRPISQYCRRVDAEMREQAFRKKIMKDHPTFGKSEQEILEYNRKRKERQKEILDGKTSIFNYLR